MHRLRVPRPSHATLVAYLALAVAMTGTAAAASGGVLVLGGTNFAGRTTVLESATGAPLGLRAGSGEAPLRVNSRRLVSRLNADLLDGAQGSTYLRSLCAPGDAPTRRYRCTSSYMRHVPVVQPTSDGQPVAGSVGTGFADCEGSLTVGGGFILGEGDAPDVLQASRPRMSGFRPIGWEVTVRPNAAGDGRVNDGTFAYALCVKGNATNLP